MVSGVCGECDVWKVWYMVSVVCGESCTCKSVGICGKTLHVRYKSCLHKYRHN